MKHFKAFFIIIVISLMTVTVNAGNTATDSNAKADSTSITFTKVYNDVKEGINGLAIALKEPAEHVYKIFVKQQLIENYE